MVMLYHIWMRPFRVNGERFFVFKQGGFVCPKASSDITGIRSKDAQGQYEAAKAAIFARKLDEFAHIVNVIGCETLRDTSLMNSIENLPQGLRNKLRGEIEKVIHGSSEREQILQTLGLQKTVTELERELAISGTTIKALEARILKQQSLIFSQLSKIAAAEEADKTRKIIESIIPNVDIRDYTQTSFKPNSFARAN